jgi:hypothetical protein
MELLSLMLAPSSIMLFCPHGKINGLILKDNKLHLVRLYVVAWRSFSVIRKKEVLPDATWI